MKKVAVINCGCKKNSGKLPACEMYSGSLFVASQNFVRSVYSNYVILSAKYFVLFPDTIIEPYDMYLGNFSKSQKQCWGEKTAKQLMEYFPNEYKFFFYCSKSYLEYVLPVLDKFNRSYECYLNNLGLGYKIQWFKYNSRNTRRLF